MRRFDFCNGSAEKQLLENLEWLHKNEEYHFDWLNISHPMPGLHMRAYGNLVFGYYISEEDKEIAEEQSTEIGFGDDNDPEHNRTLIKLAIAGRLKEDKDGCHFKGIIMPDLVLMLIMIVIMAFSIYNIFTDAQLMGVIFMAFSILMYFITIVKCSKREDEAYEVLESHFGKK